MSPAVTSPSLFADRFSLRGSCSAAGIYPLEVQHDIGHVLHDARQGSEFMLRARDLDRGDGGAFERREQHAAEGIADRVAIAGFKRLGDKLGVGFSGRALVFREGFGISKRPYRTGIT